MITTAITESVGSDLKACVLNLGAQATDKTPPLTSVPGQAFCLRPCRSSPSTE